LKVELNILKNRLKVNPYCFFIYYYNVTVKQQSTVKMVEELTSLPVWYMQPVDARWRHGAEWAVRVRYHQLNDDDQNDDHEDDDDDDVRVSGGWEELFVSSEATSTIIDSLRPDRQYLIVVDAGNEVGYNASLTARSVVIPDTQTSKS